MFEELDAEIRKGGDASASVESAMYRNQLLVAASQAELRGFTATKDALISLLAEEMRAVGKRGATFP